MNETNQELLDNLKKLREPFPVSAVSKLPKGNVMLDYIGHANITDRLLNIDPFWAWEPFAIDERGLPAMDYDAQGKPVGLWIKLTVCGMTRLGYGSCEARKNEPVKELIGDALRNAAMRFGVALELWSKAELESQHDENAPRQSTPAPRPKTPQSRPQQAAAPRQPAPHGNEERHSNGPKLSPMQKLQQKCEREGVAVDPAGRANPQHIFETLKGLNFSGTVTQENWETAFERLREVEFDSTANAARDNDGELFDQEPDYPAN